MLPRRWPEVLKRRGHMIHGVSGCETLRYEWADNCDPTPVEVDTYFLLSWRTSPESEPIVSLLSRHGVASELDMDSTPSQPRREDTVSERTVTAAFAHPKGGIVCTSLNSLGYFRRDVEEMGAATTLVMRDAMLDGVLCPFGGFAAAQMSAGTLVVMQSTHASPLRVSNINASAIAAVDDNVLLCARRNGNMGLLDIRDDTRNVRKPLHLVGRSPVRLRQLTQLPGRQELFVGRGHDGSVHLFDVRGGSPHAGPVSTVARAIYPNLLDLSQRGNVVMMTARGETKIGFACGFHEFGVFDPLTSACEQRVELAGCLFESQLALAGTSIDAPLHILTPPTSDHDSGMLLSYTPTFL
jgi:hypothetical protein